MAGASIVRPLQLLAILSLHILFVAVIHTGGSHIEQDTAGCQKCLLAAPKLRGLQGIGVPEHRALHE